MNRSVSDVSSGTSGASFDINLSRHKFYLTLSSSSITLVRVATPKFYNKDYPLWKLEDGIDLANPSHSRSLIRGLNYMTHTHPDIMFSLSMLSRYMYNPTKQHLGSTKRVLHYVAGIIDFKIWYSKIADFSLIGYSDSDWAGSMDNRKSTSGNVLSLGSEVISWSSRKQDVVAISSSEEVYIFVTLAVYQSI
ncbi:hypothetical protein BC332_14806 [Capsicum chinense]|nr:hypothetical protein BC332_14806 [Capsicum chinense]